MRGETRTRDTSKKRARTRMTPPTTSPRRRARQDRMKERDCKETKDTYWEESASHNITNNTRMKEEIKAVIPACTKGCLDLNPRHHKVGPLQCHQLKTQ